MDLDRTPPSDVREALRKEVGFGCPICRSPFLTYHHFNPPWREKNHHEPTGMIALCAKHHDAADRSTYSVNYLETLKKGDYSASEVKEVFPWMEKEVLVRLGRFYVGGISAIMPVHCDPIVTVDKDKDGLLLMSLSLQGEDGKPLISMDCNEWIGNPSQIHDLVVSTSGTDIRVWHGTRDVGLQLCFDRMTPTRFDRLLESDAQTSRRKLDRVVETWLRRTRADDATVTEVRKLIAAGHPLKGLLPDGWVNDYNSIPRVRSEIESWAKEHASDSKGNVVVLNIENLVAYSFGRKIEIRNSNLLGAAVVVSSWTADGFAAVFP